MLRQPETVVLRMLVDVILLSHLMTSVLEMHHHSPVVMP